MKGFRNASDLVAARVREAGEARGFAASRLLTHWAEVVGEDVAHLCRPSGVRYGRGKAKEEGATLLLEVAGPAALRLQMEAERIRARVNAVYGYAAIRAIRIRQVGPQGFSVPPPEVQAAQQPLVPPDLMADLAPEIARPLTEVGDTDLRLALAALAANVLGKSRG